MIGDWLDDEYPRRNRRANASGNIFDPQGLPLWSLVAAHRTHEMMVSSPSLTRDRSPW